MCEIFLNILLNFFLFKHIGSKSYSFQSHTEKRLKGKKCIQKVKHPIINATQFFSSFLLQDNNLSNLFWNFYFIV